MEAVMEEEGAATAMVKLLATGLAFVMLIASGLGVQVTPGMLPQVTLTVPAKPPAGVTVMFDIPLIPAVTVTAAPATVKLPVEADVTVTVVFPAPDEAEFE
jgi:hypothetical protein